MARREFTVSIGPAYAAVEARAAADSVRGRVTAALGGDPPVAAIILGSGLGGLANQIAGAVAVPFREIPGFPSASVAGHAGALIAGRLAGRAVLALAGRFHIYEGHDVGLAALPVRVMHALGARTLIVSNAAGGVRRTFRPGDLMLIDDHINLMFRNPLIGPVGPGEVRFPDMSAPYDRELRALAREAGLDAGIPVQEGVYAGLLGPAYETQAEVRMLERLGADAAGMSTIPEVIVARALEMRVLGVSCITNLACGLAPTPPSHEEVLSVAARAGSDLERIVNGVLARL
ncbi:MAG: purine-nucleoside phosphorylase [Gemmatimonadota bacterium]|nr:purine-nucleoside phosphorylase [Gemmatimonadota bacterium]